MEHIPHFDPQRPRVLVTGAAGLLGRYVVRELLRQGVAARGLDLRAGAEDIEWQAGDITDPAAVAQAVQGCFAVLHIAARPNIWSGDEDDIFRINTLGAWNVLRACEAAGVARVVLCSSDSVMGYTVREGAMVPPDYLPVDLAHPLRATDPYALSKVLGEDIGRAFALRGIEVIAMRTVFVAYPEMEGEIRARARDPDAYVGRQAGGPSSAGGGPLFNYIDPRDLAHAFWLALRMPSPGTAALPFEAFYLAAADTLAPEPTVQRLERLLGRPVPVRDPALYQNQPHASLYDLAPARARLGFVPRHSLRHLIDPAA
ncbi:MAG TPA: NAD-dependent epimerase/dehydratase family protein [Bordetella sp.]|nr:NAD-dependent epimerase/dehydratase family protein [Bordetella sp.]